MPAPAKPTVPKLFKGQIVYIRCIVDLPSHERYEDKNGVFSILRLCDGGGRPDADIWYYVPDRRCIPRTQLAGEIK